MIPPNNYQDHLQLFAKQPSLWVEERLTMIFFLHKNSAIQKQYGVYQKSHFQPRLLSRLGYTDYTTVKWSIFMMKHLSCKIK